MSSAIVLRTAFRDFRRRPAQSALVVTGLLVASLVISAALVAGDSLEALFLENTFRSLGHTDLIVTAGSGTAFDAQEVKTVADDPKVNELSDAVAGRMVLRGTAMDTRNANREPIVNIIGIDPVADRQMGRLRAGSRVLEPVGASIVINRRLARRLAAEPGDTLEFLAAGAGPPVALSGKVGAIADNVDKGDLGLGPDAFVDLAHLERAFGGRRVINQIVISANGGPRDPRDASALERATEGAIGKASADGGPRLTISASKRRFREDAKEQTRFFRAILTMLGSVVALASIALIANLFVMLGEERRSQRGTMRALGLRRRGLIGLGIAEGLLYSGVAAAIGAVAGAFFGRYLATAMGDLFRRFSQNSAVEFARAPFEFRAGTLITAGIAGFLVSMLAVGSVSFRTSRMTIVSAIRGLAESSSQKARRIRVRYLLVAAGGAVMFGGPDITKVIGGALVILGVCGALTGITRATRLIGTMGAIAGLAWGLWTNTFFPDFDKDPESSFGLVTVTGVVGVISAVAMISFNLSGVRRLAGIFGPRVRATVAMAAAYADGFRFRTAMSMAMFGLVLYMIAAFAIWGGFGGGDIDAESGGFDVFARSTVPIDNPRFEGADEVVGMYLAIYREGYKVGDSQKTRFPVRVYGIDADLAQASFGFVRKGKGRSAREVWSEVAGGSGVIVIDRQTDPGGTEVGDPVVMSADAGERTFTLAGVADESSLGGLFISRADFEEMFPARVGESVWLIKVAPGVSPAEASRNAKRTFSQFGLDAKPVTELIEEDAAAQRTFVGLFQLLLKLGLVIGISGLAIGSVRTVLERRQAIGILRAMGFQSSMVGLWLVVETLLIATLGVAAGLGVGLVGTYWLIGEQVPNYTLSIDLPQITSTLLIIYLAVLAFTAIPALRASRLKPSDAVRYVE